MKMRENHLSDNIRNISVYWTKYSTNQDPIFRFRKDGLLFKKVQFQVSTIVVDIHRPSSVLIMFALLHSFHFLHPSPPLSSRKPQFSNGTGVPPTKAEKLAFLRKCLLKTRKRVFSFQNACKGFSLRRKESTQLKIFSSIDIFNQTTQLKTFS